MNRADILKLRIEMSGMNVAERKYSAIPSQSAKATEPDTERTEQPQRPTKPAAEVMPDGAGQERRESDATKNVLPRDQPLGSRSRIEADQAGDDTKWAADASTRLRHAFLKRHFSAELLEARPTPNALLCRFKGSDRLTVDLVQAKASEIRTTDALDILAVREGVGEVVVSLARPHRKTLLLHDVWRGWHPNVELNTDLLIAVKEDDGGPLFLSPYPQPHTLVAGFTGSGKSVLIQNIVLAIAATNTPANARIAIIDPKQGLDFLPFEELPHLQFPVISDPDASVQAFEGFVAEMESRYTKFRAAKVNDIDLFARKTGESLPRIWIIHDEFGDWMQDEQYQDRITAFVNRIGQKSRAAGLYLIFCSQRPDNSVFPMILRSNLGNRLVLKVDSPGTSEIATGHRNMGAEKLLGKGHLLALLGNYPAPVFAQVPFVAPEELIEQVRIIQRRFSGNGAND